MVDNTDVARYYNANTRHFLRFGGSGDTAAIHRAIWAPEVTNKAEAFAYLNGCIAKAIEKQIGPDPSTFSILDLGCGVGGTATALSQQLGVSVTGISISENQIHIARQRARALEVSESVTFLQADFTALPTLPLFDAACAIESFVHCSDAASFFAMAAAQLKPGGKLVLCDDFWGESDSQQANLSRAKFKRGWHIRQLLSLEQVQELARNEGFLITETHDLSPYTRSFPRPALWLLDQLTRIPLPFAYWQNLSGGTALQRCLKQSWTRYYALVLTRENNC